jgi:outer membrane protein assembly factor BamB
VTLANNVVFTTTYDGRLSAFSEATGRVLWSSQLPSATNAPVAVIGDTVITAASLPNPNTLGEIVAFRLGASGTFAGRLRR